MPRRHSYRNVKGCMDAGEAYENEATTLLIISSGPIRFQIQLDHLILGPNRTFHPQYSRKACGYRDHWSQCLDDAGPFLNKH